MFRKGQLVRHVYNRERYLVIEVSWPHVRVMHPVRRRPFNLLPSKLELIGNNYKSKLTDKK